MIYIQKIGGIMSLSGGEKGTITKYLDKVEYIANEIEKRVPLKDNELNGKLDYWYLAIKMEEII